EVTNCNASTSDKDISKEMSSLEDIRKWSVDDVYNFISEITNCTFKDHMIDGETLPLLTEDHLLDTLGLKLGPALKIRSQVFAIFQKDQILSQ
uniref:SAM domain-containing protein n=1 Tax=Sinocyclocheilus rhinocerous TaxID=307959 RepID=A0A673MS80_9TELE